MPKVVDKQTGDVVSRQPYTSEGTQRAEQIAEPDENWELDYAPAGKKDAPGMRESYYLGGKIPGEQNFGVNPNTLSPDINPMGVGPGVALGKAMTMKPPIYKKGGKVKK